MDDARLAAVAETATRLRVERGLDAAATARAARIDEERFAAFEAAEATLAADELQRLADTLGVPTEALFGARTTRNQNLG